MTTIDKIKAEIERLKGQLIRGACAAQIEMETNCKEEAYDEVISFLSTLEPEKPIIPDDLEEAAGEYSFNIPSKLFHLLSEDQQILWKKEIEQAYLAGAVNEREKMMKEAVEKDIHELYTDEEGYHCYVSLGTDYMPGDRVHIIIVKEN